MAATNLSLPASLSPPPTPREAVADALYRCLLGLDTKNLALFESALAEDVRLSFNEKSMEGMDQLRTYIFDPHASKLETTHFISNVRVSLGEGGSTADMSASCMTQHHVIGTSKTAGAPHYLTGSLLMLELARDDADGLWKIGVFNLADQWGVGDRGVLEG